MNSLQTINICFPKIGQPNEVLRAHLSNCAASFPNKDLLLQKFKCIYHFCSSDFQLRTFSKYNCQFQLFKRLIIFSQGHRSGSDKKKLTQTKIRMYLYHNFYISIVFKFLTPSRANILIYLYQIFDTNECMNIFVSRKIKRMCEWIFV